MEFTIPTDKTASEISTKAQSGAKHWYHYADHLKISGQT